MSANTRRIIYINARGVVGFYEVTQAWISGAHLQGFCGDKFHTFRLDRIIEDIDDGEDVPLLLVHYQAEHSKNESTNGAAAAPKPGGLRVLFTGFPQQDRAVLEALATANGLHVVKTVVNELDFLCVNGHIGPGNLARNGKIDKARAKGALILTDAQLVALLETGEVPDYED